MSVISHQRMTTVGFKYRCHEGSNILYGPADVLTSLTQLEPLGPLKEQECVSY